MTTPPPSLAEVLGRNARELRNEARATTGEIASLIRTFGIPKWADSRTSALERGNVSPTVPTLYSLALTFTAATGRPIGVVDLLDHDGPVRVSESIAPVGGDELRQFVTGTPIAVDAVHDESETLGRFVGALLGKPYEGGGVSPAVGEAERKAARTLGLTTAAVAEAAQELWGRTFTEERDARVGSNFSPQRKGHVSRALIAEIRKHRGDDQ